VRTLRLSLHAEEDIVSILAWSFDKFGGAACRRYEALFVEAFDSLCKNPEKFGSIARPEFGDSVRTYHLRFSRDEARTEEGIVHKPRHLLAYRLRGEQELEVVRILHDSMELERHLPALPQEDSHEEQKD
jgi:toxin ParE1/3/4